MANTIQAYQHDPFTQQTSAHALAAFDFQGYDDFFAAPDMDAFYQAQTDYLPPLPQGQKYPQDMIMISQTSNPGTWNPADGSIVSTRMPAKVKKAKKEKAPKDSEAGPMSLPCPEPGCEKVCNRFANTIRSLTDNST
jgi:hypothetical protein